MFCQFIYNIDYIEEIFLILIYCEFVQEDFTNFHVPVITFTPY